MQFVVKTTYSSFNYCPLIYYLFCCRASNKIEPIQKRSQSIIPEKTTSASTKTFW